MLRKFAIAAATMTLLVGYTIADDESPLEKLMEQIQNKTNAKRR